MARCSRRDRGYLNIFRIDRLAPLEKVYVNLRSAFRALLVQGQHFYVVYEGEKSSKLLVIGVPVRVAKKFNHRGRSNRDRLATLLDPAFDRDRLVLLSQQINDEGRVKTDQGA